MKHKIGSRGVALDLLDKLQEREEGEQGEEGHGGERRLKKRLTDAFAFAPRVLITVPAC